MYFIAVRTGYDITFCLGTSKSENQAVVKVCAKEVRYIVISIPFLRYRYLGAFRFAVAFSKTCPYCVDRSVVD